jgi:hypothetical protein
LTQEDPEPPILPAALRVVAYLFIIGGVLSVIDIIVAFTQGQLKLNFGVLGLFIGPGLLHLRAGWRTCALIFLWITIIFCVILGLLIVGSGRDGTFKFYSKPVGSISPGVGVLIVVGFLVLAIWEVRVLTRPDVRKLFGLT